MSNIINITFKYTYIAVGEDVSIGVGDGQDDPINVLDEVWFSNVNHQLVDSVKSYREADPLAAMEERLHHDDWFPGILER